MQLHLIQRWMETMMEFHAKESLISGRLMPDTIRQPSKIMIWHSGVV